MASIKTLSDSEAAYIAGIIDGEGTVTLTRIHSKENRRPVVSVSNNERSLLEYIKSTVGAGRIINKARAALHHSPSFTYVILNRQALDLLSRVEPFLRTHKAERARLLLDEYLRVTPRNGRYTATQLRSKKDFEARFLAIRVRAKRDGQEPTAASPVHTTDHEDRDPSSHGPENPAT